MKTFEGYENYEINKYDLVKIKKGLPNIDEKYWSAWGIIQNNKEPYVLEFIGKFSHLNTELTTWCKQDFQLSI